MPVATLARRLAAREEGSGDSSVLAEAKDSTNNSALTVGMPLAGMGSGKKCPECGAHALHKVDGCLRCSNCNHIGSCG